MSNQEIQSNNINNQTSEQQVIESGNDQLLNNPQQQINANTQQIDFAESESQLANGSTNANDQILCEIDMNKSKNQQDTNENGQIEANSNQIHIINSEYYNENNIPKYNDIIDYENSLRAEIEKTTPLISKAQDIETLINEYKGSIFENSIKEISKKYKFIKYARRDGNCFYRSYLYRLFEHCCINNDKDCYEDVLKKIEGCKDLLEFNGFDWVIVEDFYGVFVQEFKLIMTLSTSDRRPYLDMLFDDREKGNYMIAFMRIYISAYIKENRLLYENFIIDEDLDTWCRREVEPIDVECDNLQIIAITNCFNVGVLIENLSEKKIESMILPEEGCKRHFIHMFFRPGHYDILYNN